ncbi:hypothetical protein LSH36_553g00005 [Paralvinella palmiformis]|uniref:Uncharacterized protein n=1 Tax=Paralvinella palmiformis TaxID=53620 RepID=A0AAD9MXI2_9ANNE|nr:hypothetical protein LSH36_553g00005 [Paralvinella palmiformis]
MQCSTRLLVVTVFLGLYLVFTAFLAKVEHSCPTLEQLVLLDENKPFANALQRMASAVNQSSFDPEITGPLVKLGIDLPAPVPDVSRKPPIPAPTVHAHERLAVSDLLRPEYAPNNVFYVWCGRRWFEFHHYLSVMSTIREFRPDNIIFFYDEQPVLDSWMYNTWFDELRADYPFFRLWQLNDADRKEACSDQSATVNQKFINGLLTYRGGIYVHESTILSRIPVWFRNHSLIDAIDRDTGRGFMLSQRGIPGRNVPVDDILRAKEYHTLSVRCSTVTEYVKAYRKPMCVSVSEPFFPKDIWELDNSFGRLVRRVFYTNPDIRRPNKSYDQLIPNIAHIVWLGGGKMDFLFYLCVLSLVYVAEVDKVYIHGDAPPAGPYWDRIKSNEKVSLIYRDSPGMIYGTKVDIISHVTDVWRVDFMVRYGGIYVDTDTVFVKPLDREIRAYDAVGSYDWTYWNPPFPDTINFGVAIGKRNPSLLARVPEVHEMVRGQGLVVERPSPAVPDQGTPSGAGRDQSPPAGDLLRGEVSPHLVAELSRRERAPYEFEQHQRLVE